ncbi:hypothetical protein [Flavobacterium sp.]|uniref:hypothetical protein n=1 Tax=Flavobacterium sp. TaxID=239 RepID=UPI0026014AB1|nr:hypothetical protein [Flavobacterium sp.]
MKATLKNLIIASAIPFLLSLAGCAKSKEITGTWYWKSATGNTELYLVQKGKQITGNYCSSFGNGSKLDCKETDADNAISLNLITENVYEGTVKSGINDAVINIRIILKPDNQSLYLEQLSQPNEEYYLPNKATFTLN